MGRYYSGDIEGKFWFGIQSSDDASFFGGFEIEPSYLEYQFSKKDDWESVLEGIETCKKELGDWKQKLDEFFKKNGWWNDDMLKEQVGIDPAESRRILEWYARLELGEKIKKCLEENEHCYFEAEL